MSEDNLERVLKKISKLLALSESDNMNEAATAIRQAKFLMDKHNLNSSDAERTISKVSDKYSVRRPAWTRILASACCNAFGCSGFSGDKSISFVGRGCSPQLAMYAYERVANIVKGVKGENNRKLFCFGAVEAVRSFASSYSESEKAKDQEWFKKVKLANIGKSPRGTIKVRRDKEGEDAFIAGKNLKIRTPVGTKQNERIGHNQHHSGVRE